MILILNRVASTRLRPLFRVSPWSSVARLQGGRGARGAGRPDNSNGLDCGRRGIPATTGQERQKCQDFIHGSKSGYRVVGVRPAHGRRKKGGGQGIRETGNQKPSGQEG